MPGLLASAGPTDAERAAHDLHRTRIVLAVLGVLAVYAWLFTRLPALLHLPTAADVLGGLAPLHGRFDRGGALTSHLSVSLAIHDDLLVLFAGAALAFLAGYYAPLSHKRPALVATTLAMLAVLYGPGATAWLVGAHATVFVVLHRTRAPRWLRTLVVQAPIVVVLLGAIVEGLGGASWKLPLGVLLFFWHWERLILYGIDVDDGRVPASITFPQYLAVFVTPGGVAKWTWGVTIGQGYAYTEHAFYAEDKNRLALVGLALWAWALGYLVIGDYLLQQAIALVERGGIALYDAHITHLVDAYLAGKPIQPASVLATTLFDVIRWLVLWGGIVHFKVGLWRVCGYRVDPYFDKPFLATNLVAFWSRFTFHYREFLARAFYYPVFFRCFKRHRRLRILVATLAAATIGNLVWGHVTERLFYRGLAWHHVPDQLATWPYFLLLGLGIGLSELWLVRKRRRRRKPWTWGWGLALDIACAYATVQFYGLITIFARPEGATPWQLAKLVGIGLGITR